MKSLPKKNRGLTLVELMIAMVIVVLLARIAIPMYGDYQEKAKVAIAIEDIAAMSAQINLYWNDARQYPNSLADVGLNNKLDPWGQPYVYYNIDANGIGRARKDRVLNPLNSDFDIYSIGKDNASSNQITQRFSLDDVIRANDGKFIDLAKNY